MMPDAHRHLILAAEIAGLLHDLGKCHPEFAKEKMRTESNSEAPRKDMSDRTISEAHGAILEDDRHYPPPGDEGWLQKLRNDSGWREVLRIPCDWCLPNTVNALGLGDPLRLHHAGNSMPLNEVSLLGEIYAYGADTRDSTLDKGSGPTKFTKSCEQRVDAGFFADSFGNEVPKYVPKHMEQLWPKVASAVQSSAFCCPNGKPDVDLVRRLLLARIGPLFRQALADTRRPTNDVTLWHHAFSSASHFKAAIAEGVLRRDFKQIQHQVEEGGGYFAAFNIASMRLLRFRLLAVRWDWLSLCGAALRPVTLTSLNVCRARAIRKLVKLIERDYAIGNVLYRDDDGVVAIVPGFYELDDQDGGRSESLFREKVVNPLRQGIEDALLPLGVGVPFMISWTTPQLYLTDLRDALTPADSSPRVEHLQVGAGELQDSWSEAGKGPDRLEACAQCGMRPARAREPGHAENTRKWNSLCKTCASLEDEKAARIRRRDAAAVFVVAPAEFDLHVVLKKRQEPGNPRLVLISAQVDAGAVTSAEFLLTQIARPTSDFDLNESETCLGNSGASDWGEWIHVNVCGAPTISRSSLEIARKIAGDDYWGRTSGGKADGRFAGAVGDRVHGLIEELFRRECPNPANLELIRHDGDLAVLYGIRKHASPSRLSRTWDDLRELWSGLVRDIALLTSLPPEKLRKIDLSSAMLDEPKHYEGYFIPISLDLRGLRVIVAAQDAGYVLRRIAAVVQLKLGKVRASLPVHVSAVAFREKFPLYVALDALRRMDARARGMKRETWHVDACERNGNDQRMRLVHWATERGKVTWRVNTATGDPDRRDIWYPHVVRTAQNTKAERPGPSRIVHVDDLAPGDVVSIPPSTFDFMVLDSTTRRYEIAYDPQTGTRPHLVMGKPGRPPHLLEQIPEILDLVPKLGWNTAKRKGVHAMLAAAYERWLRDPGPFREQGKNAWSAFARAVVNQHADRLRSPEARELLIEQVIDGRFFDACEWHDFIKKGKADEFSGSNAPAAEQAATEATQ